MMISRFGMPTRMPGPGDDDDDFPLPGMPTNMPGPGDDDLPIFMPTRGPTMMPTRMPGPSDDDFPLPGMPTRMPGPGDDDDDFPLPGMPTRMPGPGNDDFTDDFSMPTRPPSPYIADDDIYATPIPTEAPTRRPTPAPTEPELKTLLPTPNPTTSEAVNIDMTIEVVVLGVSAEAWSASKETYDMVFKRALVDTIGNVYITVDNIISVVVTAMSPATRRTLRQTETYRRLETDRVEVQARIKANGVIGDTPDTIDLRLKQEVANGDFTRNLNNEAKVEGASGLEDAQVGQYSQSSNSAPSKPQKKGLSLDAIYGISFGCFALCMICCIGYYLTATPLKPSSDGNETGIAEGEANVAGVVVAPKHGHEEAGESVHNPLATRDTAVAGAVRSFNGGKTIAPDAPTRDSDYVPPYSSDLRKSAHVPNFGEEDEDEDELADSFDSVSPIHGSGAFGGEKFSQSLAAISSPPATLPKKQRQPSMVSRRDTIPMTAEMAAAAAAVTKAHEEQQVDEIVSTHTSFSDAQKSVSNDSGPASGGLSRAEFFAKKLGKSGASKSPPKPVEGVEDASEDFEKL